MSLAFSCHQRDIVLNKTKNIFPKKLKFSRGKRKKKNDFSYDEKGKNWWVLRSGMI